MSQEISLHDLPDALDDLTYPIDRTEAAVQFDGIALRLADGEADLAGLIRETPQSCYDSSDELMSDLHTTLPRKAVGDPYQSEGDA